MTKTVSLIMSAYNEEKTVGIVLGKIRSLDFLHEIVIIDNGSTDSTYDIMVEAKKKDNRVKIFRIAKNKGLGLGLRLAIENTTGDIVVRQDADLEYEPNEFKELIEPIKKGVADVVYGSRLSGGKPQRVYMFWHKVGNSIITLVTNILYNSTLSDIETCYKVFRRDVIKDIKIRSKGFSVEPEITAKILKKKHLRIYEMPISYYGRTYQEGKKITWRQGFSAVATLFWYRFFD